MDTKKPKRSEDQIFSHTIKYNLVISHIFYLKVYWRYINLTFLEKTIADLGTS